MLSLYGASNINKFKIIKFIADNALICMVF